MKPIFKHKKKNNQIQASMNAYCMVRFEAHDAYLNDLIQSGFNSSMVRLGVLLRKDPCKVDRVSIPVWYDWKGAGAPRL